MPTISVIVPVYNVKRYLPKCVQSIVDQTFEDLEILLIDDGSTDGSGELCDLLAQKDSRIRVIHKENGGLSEARNRGIEEATAGLIGFVDSDDHIAKDMYEVLYGQLRAADAQISICGIYNEYEDHCVAEYPKKELYVVDGKEAFRMAMEGRKFSVPAWNKLYHKSLFDKIKFPLGKLSEDAFIIPEVLSKAGRVAITTEPKYYYVHRMNSITSSAFRDKDFHVVEAYRRNLEYTREHFPQFEEQAMFRYLWSYMVVLDKMVGSGDPESIEGYVALVQKIRGNTFKILTNRFFTNRRKLATLVLLLSRKAYGRLTKVYRNQTMRLIADEAKKGDS